MADPFTMAAIGIGATVAGGATSAYGQYAQGQSTKAMYGYQAGVAQLNQKIALQNRDYTLQAGGTAVRQAGLKLGQMVGNQKVAQSGSGLDLNQGSAEKVRADTLALGEEDIGTISTNYAKKAYGYEVEAATKSAEAGADLIAGSNASKAGAISAAGTFLSTAGSVASKWYQGSQAGLWGGDKGLLVDASGNPS